MTDSRGLVAGAGALLIGISLAFVFLVLPEQYTNTTVGKSGLAHLVLAEILLLATFLFVSPKEGADKADLPARLVLPAIVGGYTLAVAVVFLGTPVLDKVTTIAIGLHLLLAAGFVVTVGVTVFAGGHAKATEAKDEKAQQGYELMTVAARSMERGLSENPNRSELGDVPKEVTQLKESVQFSDRGGLAETADMEQAIADGLRSFGTSLASMGADGIDDALGQLRALRLQIAERNDILKTKK